MNPCSATADSGAGGPTTQSLCSPPPAKWFRPPVWWAVEGQLLSTYSHLPSCACSVRGSEATAVNRACPCHLQSMFRDTILILEVSPKSVPRTSERPQLPPPWGNVTGFAPVPLRRCFQMHWGLGLGEAQCRAGTSCSAKTPTPWPLSSQIVGYSGW